MIKNSYIYTGNVIHKRFKPKIHSFNYSVFSLLIDLSEINLLHKTLKIFSQKDHRIAMAFFCLGQIITGKVLIHNFETVNTSFSSFLEIMKKIGAKYEIKK